MIQAQSTIKNSPINENCSVNQSISQLISPLGSRFANPFASQLVRQSVVSRTRAARPSGNCMDSRPGVLGLSSALTTTWICFLTGSPKLN